MDTVTMKTIGQIIHHSKYALVINDPNGNKQYYEDSCGYWAIRKFDSRGWTIYFENSEGEIVDQRGIS